MATILIVDDDTDTREVLSRFIQREGYNTVTAANGWEALLALDDHHVDLILLDVMMPGMNGMTFLNILRNAQKKMKTPVVLVTAMSSDSIETDARRLGVAEVVPKTQNLFNRLLPVIRRNLDTSGVVAAFDPDSN